MLRMRASSSNRISRLPLAAAFGLFSGILLGCAARESPTIAVGQIETNAHIVCSYVGRPDFTASHVGLIFGIPYLGGPETHYGGEPSTECHATTDAKYDSVNAATGTAVGTLHIVQKLGGTCQDSNTGGGGTAQPRWLSTLTLPPPGLFQSWRLSGTISTTVNDVYPVGSTAIQPCRLSITGGNYGRLVSFNRPASDQKYSFDKLHAGTYQLELSCPGEITKGCQGAQPGTALEGTAEIILDLKAEDP
jgi:hypothetical protein